MCKQTRTKDHTICDIELGNNPYIKIKPIKHVQSREEAVYQKLPLSEHVSSAPQLLHRRWHVWILVILNRQRGHSTCFGVSPSMTLDNALNPV